MLSGSFVGSRFTYPLNTMSINIALIVFCAAALSIAKVESKKQTCTSGNFKFNNQMCEWEEQSCNGNRQRTLKVDCGRGRMCSYTGDPHKNKWYNKHHVQFYKGLVKDLVEEAEKANQNTPCYAPSATYAGIVFHRDGRSTLLQIFYDYMMNTTRDVKNVYVPDTVTF